MLAQGGVVAKSVFAIMVIMSFASWYIMLTKLWDQRRIRKAYKEVEKGFWTAGNLRDGIAKLSGKDNAFKMIAEDGIRAAQHHGLAFNVAMDLEPFRRINPCGYRGLEVTDLRTLGVSLELRNAAELLAPHLLGALGMPVDARWA